MFLPHLPVDAIRARYVRAPGRELQSGKFESPESSASLVANTLGLFMEQPEALPPPPDWRGPWAPRVVTLEEQMRFPWAGGRHPWLDVVIESGDDLIGVESKRYEPFRGHTEPKFSKAFRREVWGLRMARYQWIRDGLSMQPTLFEHLDAAQLVKHALGLRTQAKARKKKRVVLLYLHAEPQRWPVGKRIDDAVHANHRAEIEWFRRMVAGDEVHFLPTSYRAWLARMAACRRADVRHHAGAVTAAFDV